LKKEKMSLFPDAQDRIPNFKGADEAVPLLLELPEWQRGKTMI